jgi:hypothetical protein
LISLSEDLCKLNSCAEWVSTKDESGITLEEVADVLEVLLSLLLIVVEWK